MKSSIYNIIFDQNGKKYIFNTRTCALAEINDEVASTLNKTKNLDFREKEKIEKQMQDAGFIISDETDELAILKYKYYKGKSANPIINIAPTMLCNFECPYCYENADDKFIKDKVKEAIYKRIENIIQKVEKITLVWFGGEPLLAKEIVKEMSEKISQLCKKYNTECIYNIITNGYLLNRSTVSELLNLGINHAQITIDGTPGIHNKRRKLRGSDSDTFYKIIKNIKNAHNMGMDIRIRINADKTNEFCLDSLLKILAKEKLQDCFINLARVRGYTKSEKNNTFSTAEYGKIVIKFAKLLKKNGFKNYDVYPSALFSNCSAGIENSLIIDPLGYMYRCLVEIGDKKHSYGNVLNYSEDDNESINNLKYLMNSPFDRKKCTNCKCLPLCMGGCAYYTLKNKNELDCPHWKFDFEDKLREICQIIFN